MSRSGSLVRGVAVAASIAFLSLFAPAGASAQLLDDVLETANDLLGPLTGSPDGGAKPGPSQQPEPSGGVPPNYVPPAHGTNEHGQGTGAVIDLAPEDTVPLPYAPGGGSEDVVLGGSRGEVNNGAYHGHVTILTLFGTELIPGADTNEGQTSTGPFGGVNALLNDICTGTGLCLSALAVASNTVAGSSANSFSVATANLNPGGGLLLLDLGAVQSAGTTSKTGECSTSSGSGRVAGANIANLVTASVIESSSSSTACSDGSSSQTNSSSVIGLQGQGVPLPAPGCENGTPNTDISIPLILGLVCNADSSSGAGGTQLPAPYGVREGLTAVALGNLVKATTAAAESYAIAPSGGGGGGGWRRWRRWWRRRSAAVAAVATTTAATTAAIATATAPPMATTPARPSPARPPTMAARPIWTPTATASRMTRTPARPSPARPPTTAARSVADQAGTARTASRSPARTCSRWP